MTYTAQSLRYSITMEVLERAKDCGDAMVVRACRECINAWRIGRKAPEAFAIVREFHNA